MRFSAFKVGVAGVCLLLTLSAAGKPTLMQAAPRELAALERGQWVLKDRDTGVERRICLGDSRQLLRLGHPKAQCARFVVTDAARQVSVTMDCAAAGNERTDIRIETGRLFQLQSQGIADGAPFSMKMEGRRVGACR